MGEPGLLRGRLAGGGKVGGAAGDGLGVEGHAGLRAELIPVPVGQHEAVRVQGLGVGVDRDGGVQDPLNCVVEAAEVVLGQLRHGRPRVDALLVEGLVGVDVAEARHDALVQQPAFDGTAAGREGRQKRVDLGAARVGAEVFRLDKRAWRVDEAHAGKLARALKRQGAPVLKVNLDVRVFGHGAVRNDLHTSGHAEVEGEPPGLLAVPDEDVLAVAVGIGQRAAPEHLPEAMRLQAVAQNQWIDDRGVGNRAVEGRVGKAPPVDDGVGQFGHSCGRGR